MKTTILGHEAAPPQSAAEIHRFRFELNDGANPHDEYVSLRTAQVLVAALDDGNAFSSNVARDRSHGREGL